ncbi:MAG: DUF1829 domain-containing protein [Planctomycetaceae bacterium]|jgi:hypothetical protein|nr:DUF1829 domain-containing protein [Planctomycetaceae bacterium]
MITNDINNILQKYYHWLQDKTNIKQIDSDWVEITTPYLDRHNDCLQIYVQKKDNTYILTDDGNIINDLINSGCELTNPKRKKILNTTLAGFGIQLLDNTLTVQATADDFAPKKHNLIQAMLAIDDMFYLATPHVTNLFFEDVTNWFDMVNIRYTPKIKLSGTSGFDHQFDFIIPKSNKENERIVQVISNPNKDNAETLVFKWIDTQKERQEGTELFALLNDAKVVPSAVVAALKNYNLNPVFWSKRNQIQSKLVT